MTTWTLIENGAVITPSRVTLNGSYNWEEILSPGSYPKMKFTVGKGLTISRAFKVPSSDIVAFGNEVCNATTISDGQHPVFTQCYIVDVDIDPFNGGDNTIPYCQSSEGIVEPLFYTCVVNYEPLVLNIETNQKPENSNGADLYEGTVNVTSEVMLSGASAYSWEGETVRIGEDSQIPKVIPIIDREIRIPRATVIPWTAIRACVGCVNSIAYFGALPQTVLYLGANISFKRAFDGTMTYGLNHKFKEKAWLTELDGVAGWNHFYRKKDKRWKKTSPLVYQIANFRPLMPGVT